MTKKKIGAFLLVFSMCFALVSSVVGLTDVYAEETVDADVLYEGELEEAEGDDIAGTITYERLTDNTIRITKYEGNIVNLVIPEKIDGYNVVIIEKEAFKNANMELLVIPDTVHTIAQNAFSGCSALEIVVMSKNIKTIGAQAFYNCTSLAAIEIPVSLESCTASSGKGPFAGCSALKEVIFETGVKRVAANLFAGCDGIEKIVIPDTVTSIDEGAFNGCSGLNELYIPNSVTVIGKNAFLNCAALPTLVLSTNVTEIGEAAFKGCSNIREVVIPNSVITIQPEAFNECSALEKLALSKNVTFIGYWAFASCNMLTDIEIPRSLESCSLKIKDQMSRGPFGECTSLKNVTFEEGVKRIPAALFAGCEGLEKIVIPDTVTSIDDAAFGACINLWDVYMPDSVTVIAKQAFTMCYDLEEIDLSDNVVSIGESAFESCDTLKGIVIPDSVTSIDKKAFNSCPNLETLTLSKNLKTMGYQAFGSCSVLKAVEIPKSLESCTVTSVNVPPLGSIKAGPFFLCSSLSDVTFEKGVSRIAENLFAGCFGLDVVDIPDTVTTINENAFYDARHMTAVTIPGSVNNISNNGFRNAMALKAVVVPNSVTTVGTYVFAGCSDMKSAKLPDGLTKIPDGTFQDCASLLEIDIPKPVTEIGKEAFQRSISLEKVIMGDNVTKIGTYVFDGCTLLTDINLSAALVEIASYAFRDCQTLPEIVFPNGLTKIGNNAFESCQALDNVVIPNSVTSIGTSCFYDNYKLNSLKLGTGLTTIPSSAFKLCPSLVDVVIPYRVTTINSQAFNSCVRLTNVTIPRGVTSIGAEAFSYPLQMTIYGAADTYAEDYAASIGSKFEAIVVLAEKVTLDVHELNLYKGKTYTFSVDVEPMNFTDTIAWKTNDPSIVSVDDNGTIKGVAAGTTVIRVYAGNVVDTCTVNVVLPVSSIKMSKTSVTMESGEELQLTATVSPEDAFDKTLVWSSSDESVATVDQNGLVKTHKKGTATIKATSTDGSNKSGSCKITVSSTTYVVDDVAGLESPHNYENNCKDSWKYTQAGAAMLNVTFDAKTKVEDGYDYINIYDVNNNVVGQYTGAQLAGQTVTVPGNTVRIQIVSDNAGNDWGFKVTDVTSSGSAPVGPSLEQIEAFVERMYTVALGRDFDEAGKATWVAMLTAGTHDGAGIAKEFILGAEFEMRGLTNEQYVDVLYQTFFNRAADEGGRNLWSTILASGQSRAYVLSQFVNLDEFTMLCSSYGISRGVMLDNGTAVNPGIPQFVSRLYEMVLGRNADATGLYNYVMALLVKAETAESVAKGFFGSAEYAMKNTNDATYVSDLYNVFMNRAADADGLSFWVNTMAIGMSRNDVLSEFAKSAEFRAIAASYGLE